MVVVRPETLAEVEAPAWSAAVVVLALAAPRVVALALAFPQVEGMVAPAVPVVVPVVQAV